MTSWYRDEKMPYKIRLVVAAFRVYYNEQRDIMEEAKRDMEPVIKERAAENIIAEADRRMAQIAKIINGKD